MKTISVLGVYLCLLTQQVAHAALVVGSDQAGPVQFYATDGTPIQPFGPSDGTAGASDGLGGLFVAIPGLTTSTINEYGPSENLLNSFFFTAPGDLRPDAAYIIDLSWGLGGTLWVSTFTGEIYHLDASGNVLGSFDTGDSSPGVAFDGTDLYTSSGPGFLNAAPFIFQRDTSGNVLGTINTGLNDTLGLGFDSSDSTLWVGGFDMLTQVDLSGNTLQSLSITGIHYGVDVADLGPTTEVPEPFTWLLTLAGVFGVAAWKSRAQVRTLGVVILGAVCAAPMMHAAITISSVTPNPQGPQPVGTSVTFFVSASDTDTGDLRYRYRVAPQGGAFAILSDYSPSTTVTWTPSDTNGVYQMEVSVLNRATQNTQVQVVPYTVSSRVAGSTPVVSPTAHPMVALYSAASCTAGASMRVRFKLLTDTAWQSTALKPCNSASSMNFYIAGMRATSTYQMRHDVINGPFITSGPILTFTTGASTFSMPPTNFMRPLQPPTSTTEGVTVFQGLDITGYHGYAVDAGLNLIWYPLSMQQLLLPRLVPGGGYTVTYGFTTDLANSGLREHDLAGNMVKQTDVERINDQLAAMGMNSVVAFHHEVRKTTTGNYLVLAQREVASSIQGPPNDISGDMILVLDNNLQVLWAWDSFLHLDVSRAAVLGETCNNGAGICVLFNATTSHDWTHGNSVQITPDGNLMYSSRHQDLVYKIAYQNGTGDGHIIWRLGKGGDFTFVSSDPYPWFSHQHDANYDDATTVSLFDDGNTRIAQSGGNSRGQAIMLDETHMTATPVLNVDLGNYSFALGSAQRLLNGNYAFGSGLANGNLTQVSEWTASGAPVSNIFGGLADYRAYRFRDLYSAPY